MDSGAYCAAVSCPAVPPQTTPQTPAFHTMSTLQDLRAQQAALLEQQAALAREIEAQLAAQRSAAIAEIKRLMAEHGLAVADLGSSGGAKGKKDSAAPAKESKVAAKYRDPATGSTWSGRGLKPKWLSAAIAEGKSLEDFLI
jgi:DNA-binding protein H-NS